MDKNKRLAVWLPVIIALSIALGIFVGNHYLRLTQGKRHIYSSGNKINAILDIIDEQYVDTVDMKQLVEDAIPKVFSELDPHSVYIPARMPNGQMKTWKDRSAASGFHSIYRPIPFWLSTSFRGDLQRRPA